jgi:ABC-type polysaccharide/polyol phosphate transport system ATPase subunit
MPGNMATEGQTEKLAEECIKFKLLKPLVAEEKIEVKSSLKKAKKKDADKEADKMDAKMAAFMNKKASVPSPEVRHEKGNNFDQDINLPLTIIVGGNHLLEDTTLRLTMGKKYGLVGRNGIGKTCLIDGISR